MANKLFNLKLDLNGRAIFPRLVVRRNDYDTNVFAATILQDGAPVDLTGTTAMFECVTPAGNFIRDTAELTDAANGKVSYTLIKEVFASLGRIQTAYFVFETGSGDETTRLSTPDIEFVVAADAITSHVQAGDYVSELQQFFDKIDQLQAELDDLKSQYTTLDPDNYALKDNVGVIDLIDASVAPKDIPLGFHAFEGTSGYPYSPRCSVFSVSISESRVFQLVYQKDGTGAAYRTPVDDSTAWGDWQTVETVSGSQDKVDDLKAITQNVKITADDGSPAINIEDSGDVVTILTEHDAGVYLCRINGSATGGFATTVRGLVHIESSTRIFGQFMGISGDLYFLYIGDGTLHKYKLAITEM